MVAALNLFKLSSILVDVVRRTLNATFFALLRLARFERAVYVHDLNVSASVSAAFVLGAAKFQLFEVIKFIF